MKKHFTFMLTLVVLSLVTSAQVAINTDGSLPDNSAILDVKSNTKGVLFPRLTYQELQALSSPAEGLMVYCTNCGSNGSGALVLFSTGIWNVLNINCLTPISPLPGPGTATSYQVLWAWNAVPGATGYKWHTWDNFTSATDLGNTTMKLETSLACSTTYNRYVWAYNACGHSEPVILNQTTMAASSPVSAPNVTSPNQVVWNWNAVPGASGYKWGTTNVFANATDMGTATSKTETGLTCQTLYTRYIWAYNSCGNSSPTTLAQTTSQLPLAPVAATHTSTSSQITWNWNPVTSAVGYKINTVNDYATATDLGLVTSRTETGLPCNTAQTRYIWAYGTCGNSSATTLTFSTILAPVSPIAGTHTPTTTSIVWNWNTVTGASGYKWNTTNNYASAINMGTATTRTETGLTCNTPYTRYVWAYNSCGNSTETTLVQSTSMSNIPATPTSGTHSFTATSVTWKWNTVSGAAGYKWNTTNNYATATNMGTATTKAETGLFCGTTYNRYVWAYTSCGISTPVTLSQSTVFCLWTCGDSITDGRDNKRYATVSINSKCWMAQNLNIGTRVNTDITQTNNSNMEKYCYLNNESYCNIYGGLYQWDEAMNYTTGSATNPSGRQGICPTGWHLPSDDEWCELESFLDPTIICTPYSMIGTDAGGKMKTSGYTYWYTPNTGATNSSGFSALPAGYISSGSSAALQSETRFWTTTEIDIYVHFHSMQNASAQIAHHYNSKEKGFSLRCVKD